MGFDNATCRQRIKNGMDPRQAVLDCGDGYAVQEVVGPPVDVRLADGTLRRDLAVYLRIYEGLDKVQSVLHSTETKTIEEKDFGNGAYIHKIGEFEKSLGM